MEKVRSGEAVTISAATWNAFIDAANYVKDVRQNRRGAGLKSGVETGIVLVQNAESGLRGRFSALVLCDIAVHPDANEDEFASCPPVFIGRAMTGDREGWPYAILLEPLEGGQIGRAMVLGVVPAKVAIQDAEDGFAVPAPGSTTGALQSNSAGAARILWKAGGAGEQWCILQLGGAGAGGGGDNAYMCKVTDGSAAAGYRVTVYPNGRDDTAGVESATLYVPDLALDADIPSGAWIIGHRCALGATGGSET